ncbi:MAG TPA: class I SAM-dependent methyltransferase [Geobacteraceae bacterium]|nr:class I SAM-dependent methyltransferase [Geobacteraceae bacterium]
MRDAEAQFSTSARIGPKKQVGQAYGVRQGKEKKLKTSYVHGYDLKESTRLQDQASTLVELLHSDTVFPSGSKILEAGCGVGAQTVTLARNNPETLITSIDISENSVSIAKSTAEAAGNLCRQA